MGDVAEGVWRVGIDAGSKTIKIVVLDAEGSIIYSAYRRHQTNTRDTLRDLIHEVAWIKGDIRAHVSVTGSAGINVSKLLGLPFVQEVVAVTEAVKRTIPDADAIIELGGEDAKVVYLTGGVEQRMNATCAGGTGGFIDTIAFMLGISTADMSTLALGAQRSFPIASRCAVFAQTDVRPLLNEGASKSDIASSALDAVVRQTLGGLACGRPLKGKVVFLGGPLQYIPELANRFRKALGLNRSQGVKPQEAHLYPALGAALLEPSSQSVSLSAVESQLQSISTMSDADDIPRLAPLFSSQEELAAFHERHGRAVFPTKTIFDVEGPLYLGIDSGSTTVKLALVDGEGKLVYSDYRPSRGDVIETTREMLLSLYRALPDSVLVGHELPYLAQATATGYGEAVLVEGFGVDSGVVETTAHLRAARELCPEATFVLDIGGQDMKALWLNGGHVSDAVLNEACSSGCGAFIEGTAHGLHVSPASFASLALEAKAPVDLGMRCTVFMSSRVKHAQKAGAQVEDIAAGVAYSVVHNALYRIIGADRAAAMGDRVVVQGGAFKSDAVLRAFELVSGVEAIRPDRAHVMGAIGAALIARDRAQRKGAGVRSGIISQEEACAMEPKRLVQPCIGCANACRLTVIDMGGDRRIVSGNRCERWQLSDDGTKACSKGPCAMSSQSAAAPANLIALEQKLIADLSNQPSLDGVVDRHSVSVGIVDGLEVYEHAPFWHALISALGFTPLMASSDIGGAECAQAWETVPAESVCFPAKLVHAKAFSLRDAGADALLFPVQERKAHCAVVSGYGYALRDSIQWLRDGTVALVAPQLSSADPSAIASCPQDKEALARELEVLCIQAGHPLEARELERALQAGSEAQQNFVDTLVIATEEALEALESSPDAHGIVLVGRPYHGDPLVMHGIDQMLVQLGFTVFSMTGLARSMPSLPHRSAGLPEWRPAKRLLKAARYILDHPSLDLVCLQSFGCGYDAVSLEEVRALLEANQRPFTALKLDEMVETAHIHIRLRTLAESIEGHRRGAQRKAQEPAEAVSSTPKNPDGSVVPQVSRLRVRLLDEPLDDQDLACARACTVKDACFSANVLAARAIRLLREDPQIQELVVPRACVQCLNEAIPSMVERATGCVPTIVWEEGAGAVGRAPEQESDNVDDRPKIGIIGNPLLVFDPYMNDDIVGLLERLGCAAVPPDEGALYTDDVRYLDQLEHFAASGVRQVIYLQSFGCVKGHVQARGLHYFYSERFPDMPLTVLDYDPEASALNRENRIRLIAETVLHDDR